MKYVIWLAVGSACLWGQPPIAFEVASVKTKQPGSVISMIGARPSGPRIAIDAMTLSGLVSFAYNVKVWQVSGGPDWAGIEKDGGTLDAAARRFDIVGKASGDEPRTVDEFRQMLQALLTDRFHVVLHHESKEMPVYALVTDKKGPKFHESARDATGILRMAGGGKITSSGSTMTMLSNWFSNANGVDRPVVDQTGLGGKYDFTLEWSNPLAGANADSTGASIFSALPEQLGLRLEPKRAPIDMLVIDRAELPSEN